MSHVATVDVDVRDLDALARACNDLGLEFVRGQTTYRWFGEQVGDYPLPAGFTEEELGRCEHAIRIPGSDDAYEIGVVTRRDGRPGYQLLWDFWGGGNGMEAKVGQDCRMLRQRYSIQVVKQQAQLKGMAVMEHLNADGSYRLTLRS